MHEKAAAMEARADELDAKASELSEYVVMLAEGGGPAQPSQAQMRRRTRFEKIRRVLQRRPDRDFTVDEVRKAISDPASAKDSVRASLASMTRRGEDERRGRGLYRFRKTPSK